MTSSRSLPPTIHAHDTKAHWAESLHPLQEESSGVARITEWYVTGTSFLLKNPSEGEVQMGCVSTRSVNAVLVGIFHCGVGFLFNVAPPRLVWIMDGTSYSNCSARCHISPLSRSLASRYVVINVMATTGLLGGGLAKLGII